MKRSMIHTGILAATVAAAVAVLPGTAGAAAPTTAPAEPGPRLERACLRIPNIETRTANLIERLQGDATVRGSLPSHPTPDRAARSAGMSDSDRASGYWRRA